MWTSTVYGHHNPQSVASRRDLPVPRPGRGTGNIRCILSADLQLSSSLRRIAGGSGHRRNTPWRRLALARSWAKRVPCGEGLEAAIRERVREIIEPVLGEEVEAALGAPRSQRVVERNGYRHGRKADG